MLNSNLFNHKFKLFISIIYLNISHLNNHISSKCNYNILLKYSSFKLQYTQKKQAFSLKKERIIYYHLHRIHRKRSTRLTLGDVNIRRVEVSFFV